MENFEPSLEDLIGIIVIAAMAAVVGEGISWVLFYRTSEYKTLMNIVEKETKRLDRQKEKEIEREKGTKDKGKKGTSERIEDQIKNANRDLSRLQLRSTMVVGVVLLSFVSILTSVYEGKVVAKLPFEPISLIHPLTHRYILGDDYTDCSAIFLYVLLSVTLRQNIQRFFGFKPPKSDLTSLFSPQPSW